MPMTQEEFEQVFERQFAISRDVLVEKAKEYASNGDRLHNFKVAAEFLGGTPEQALWGMAVKHLVSISDMVRSGETYSEAMWDEKLGDALNYLILLRAQVFASEDRVSDTGLLFDLPSVEPLDITGHTN